MRTRHSFLVALAILAGLPALAGGGTEVGGGGQSVVIDGISLPRDLVESCIWENGNTFSRRLDHFKALLNSLAATHWYFADSIGRQPQKLYVCLADAKIHLIDPNEAVYFNGAKQVAVRFGDRVIIDKNEFNSLDPRGQSYLFLHEIMHTYVPMGENHTLKVRSIVASIARNESSPMTPDEFALQIQLNDVQIIPQSAPIDPLAAARALDTEADTAIRESSAAKLVRSGTAGLMRNEDSTIVYMLYENLNSSLGAAVAGCKLADVKTELQLGADPNLIAQAMPCRNVAIVRALLDQGGNPNVTNIAGGDTSAIAYAVRSGDLAMVQTLMTSSLLDPNAPENPHSYWEQTPLLIAAGTWKNEIFAELLKSQKIDVNRLSENRRTALTEAALNGNADGVSLLLKFPGIDVNAKNDKPAETAIAVAAQAGQTRAVELLAEAPGIDVNEAGTLTVDADCYTPTCGFKDTVDFAPTHRSLTVVGLNALASAAARGDLRMFRALLNAPGIQVNQQIEVNPPDHAGMYEQIDQINDEFDFPYNDEGRCSRHKPWDSQSPHFARGDSALIVAVANHQNQVVKLLLADPRVDLALKNGNGLTARQVAKRFGHADLANLVGKAGGW